MPYVRKTADIHISEDLQSVLKLMEQNSEIAQMLLRQRHPIENLVEDYVNYICISKSDKTKISYLTQDRENSVDGDHWHSSKRFNAKPGAFIRKVFKGLSDKQVEIFSTLFKNIQNTPNFAMKVVEGNDILKYYHYESYADQSSSLGASCMKHGGCQEFLQIYVDNSDKIKMLVMIDREGRLIGRSLLWNIEPNKIMDRIYTIHDEEYSYHFKKWADNNGYWYKKEQKWNNTLLFESQGKSMLSELSVTLHKTDYRRYPYFDTFKFFDQDSKTLYNYIPSGKSIYTLSTPDGSKQNSEFLTRDGKTDLFHYHHEMVWLEYKGYRTHQSNVYYSEINDKYILKEDANYLEEINDYVFIDDSLNRQEAIKDRITYLKMRNEQREQSRKKREQDLRQIEQRSNRSAISTIFNSYFTPSSGINVDRLVEEYEAISMWVPINDEQSPREETA